MAITILPQDGALSAVVAFRALKSKRLKGVAVLYDVTNLANGHKYIGVTKNLERRIYWHFMGFGSVLLKHAIRKHGLDKFRYDILVVGDAEYMYNLEPRVIALYRTLVPNGYNIAPGGERGPDLTGRKFGPQSAETLRKLSLVRTGRKHSDAQRKANSLARIGKPKSAETRRNMSLARIGKPNLRKGIPLSIEHRRAVSLAKTGKPNGHEGRPNSDAHNKAISAGLLGHVGATSRRIDDDQKTTV